MRLSPLNQRRWRNFKANRRAWYALWIFGVLFGLSLFAEVLANDKPIVISYRVATYFPILKFYPETEFGGDFKTEADYKDPGLQCLIRTGGIDACWDDPAGVMADAADGDVAGEKVQKGWMVWPPIPYSYTTFIKKFIVAYTVTLPLGYVFVLSWLAVPVVVFIFYVLASLELIAEQIEDPFGRDRHDLPMDRLSAMIAKNVKEILE